MNGYTGGFAAEWKRHLRSLRWGIFMEPVPANERTLDKLVGKAWGQVIEKEERYVTAGHPGAVRAMVFLNRAHISSYVAGLRTTGTMPSDFTLSLG